MSSRGSRRGSNQKSARGPAIPVAQGGPRRWWLAGLGLVIIVAACWLSGWGKNLFSRADRPPATPLGRAPGSGPKTRAERQAQRNEGFNTRINRGTALLAEGKPEQALEVFSEALQLNPGDEDVHYDLGLALSRLGRTNEAVQQYQQALQIFPEYVEAHNNLGNLLMRAGQNDEAIEHFEKALKIMPEFASAHNNLGTALQRAGRTNEALVHFEKAVKIDPDYWQARFNVALSCVADGRFSEAITQLESVLRLKPDFAPAKEALAEIKTRQPGPPER